MLDKVLHFLGGLGLGIAAIYIYWPLIFPVMTLPVIWEYWRGNQIENHLPNDEAVRDILATLAGIFIGAAIAGAVLATV